MTNDDNIQRYTLEELDAMRERSENPTDWAKVDAMTEALIEAAIASDTEAAGTEWDKARAVTPEPKEHINLQLDADVLRFFKREGKGYETRINAILRAYMLSHKE